MFFVSFLQFRVVSGGFGRAIALLARSLRSPWYFAASYPFESLCFSFVFCEVGVLFDGQKTSKIYTQNIPKILEQPTSPPQKSIPKPPKIEPKALQNRGLEGIPLEIAFRSQIELLIFCSWGVSWSVLGASWACLGAFLGPTWESWGVLEAS